MSQVVKTLKNKIYVHRKELQKECELTSHVYTMLKMISQKRVSDVYVNAWLETNRNAIEVIEESIAKIESKKGCGV